MNWLLSVNWIRVGWLAAVPAILVYGIWFWPDTPEGRERSAKSQKITDAEVACERLKLAADGGAERILAHDLCEAMKRKAMDDYHR